jgi:hypothetical protein
VTALEAINTHLAAASSARAEIALLHLAQARVLLVGLEEATANARRSLEAMEREQERKGAAITVRSTK